MDTTTHTTGEGQLGQDLMWQAIYEDGKLLQFEKKPDGTIKENKYADIDRDRLIRFDFLNRRTGKPVHAVYINEGKKLIYRRRTLKRMTGEPDVVVFIVGYQITFMTNSGPRAHVVLNYLHPDGSVALDGHRDNLELLDIEY